MDPTHSTQPPLILPDDAVRIPAGVHVLESPCWAAGSAFVATR
jgi:hypothetical protein